MSTFEKQGEGVRTEAQNSTPTPEESAAAPTSEKAAAAVDSDTPDTKQHSVLVIEDDMFIADLEVRKLREKFHVYHAVDAERAREILNKHRVDIVCLDILLPGENGLSFLRGLKADEKLKDIPIIIFSNLGQEDEVEEGMRAGAVDYLIKADSMPEEISQRLENLLEGN